MKIVFIIAIFLSVSTSFANDSLDKLLKYLDKFRQDPKPTKMSLRNKKILTLLAARRNKFCGPIFSFTAKMDTKECKIATQEYKYFATNCNYLFKESSKVFNRRERARRRAQNTKEIEKLNKDYYNIEREIDYCYTVVHSIRNSNSVKELERRNRLSINKGNFTNDEVTTPLTKQYGSCDNTRKYWGEKYLNSPNPKSPISTSPDDPHDTLTNQ